MILSGLPAGNVKKFRISSLAFEPIVSGSSVVVGSITMGITGNEFLMSNAQRPLKLRCGKDYGDDGQWIVTDGIAFPTTGVVIGQFSWDQPWLEFEVPSIVQEWSTVVHIRMAWQDPT